MGIGKIMSKAMSYVAHSGKNTAKAVEKAVTSGARKSAPSILSKVESNTAGRVLRMQDAKAAFTPVKPYATKVTKTNVPTQQYLDEKLGVAKVDALKAEGIYNRAAAADALAAFKHEPIKLHGGKLGVTSTPTQQHLDNMLGIANVDALKAYENGGRATRQILENRNAAREAFTKGGDITQRCLLSFSKPKQASIIKDFTKNFKTVKPLKFNVKVKDKAFTEIFKTASNNNLKKFIN